MSQHQRGGAGKATNNGGIVLICIRKVKSPFRDSGLEGFEKPADPTLTYGESTMLLGGTSGGAFGSFRLLDGWDMGVRAVARAGRSHIRPLRPLRSL